jgi:phosphatidylserine synthase
MLLANAAVLLLIAVAVYLEAGQDAEALGQGVFWGLPVVLNLALVVPLARGGPGTRWLVVVVEVLTLLFGLSAVSRGRLGGVLLTIFSIMALTYANRQDARAWFQRHHPGQDDIQSVRRR